MASPVLVAGTMVGHFEIMHLVGRGGMGDVYLARDTRLGRKVALKMVAPDLVDSPAARERFRFEAQATARFNHPHIVTIYEVGEYAGSPYVALEFLEGETLRERIRERPGLPASLRMGLAIAQALAEAHAQGILHRDLKPENVLCPRDGRLRVVDFGLAQPIREARDDDAAAARRSGTPAYLAPELWRAGEPSAASDVWALGIILHELCRGEHPYAALQGGALGAAVASADPVPWPPAEVEGAPVVPAAVVEIVRDCLRKDAGARPSAAELAHRLAGALGAGRSIDDDVSPFRGLMPFAEEHADSFFGREAEVAELVERIRVEPVLPVVGPSGVGKSSFVHAGVVPRLREQGRWTVLQVRPGGRPFEALAAPLADDDPDSFLTTAAPGTPRRAPARPPTAAAVASLADELVRTPRRLTLHLRRYARSAQSQLLLVVDQLEEIFTLVADERIRAGFLEAICTAADDAREPVRVCFTLRDDFLGRAAATATARGVLARLVVLGVPGPDALVDILTKPLAARGYRYDDAALVGDMVAAVKGEPAALPLLQFTVQMLWNRRDREARRLARAAYGAVGGVEGALATHADAVLAGLPAGDVRLAKAVLLRLVTPERTRRAVARDDLVSGLGPDAEIVLGRLIEARLVMVRRGQEEDAEGEVELAHESLVRTWHTLARWIDEGQGELAFVADLTQAAERWEKRGRRADEAWRGDTLREARRTVARLERPLPRLLSDFLAAGEELDRRIVRRRRALRLTGVGTLAVAAVASIGVSLVVADKERLARTREAEARAAGEEARRRYAEAQREGARTALRRGDPLEARAKVRASLEAEDSPLARALWAQLQLDPLMWRRSLGSGAYSIAYAPDGRSIAAATKDGTIWLLRDDGRDARTFHDVDQVAAVAFSPDGATVAAGTWGPDVSLWDVASGKRRVLRGHTGQVWGVAFSPDGRSIATASHDGTIRVWRPAGDAAPLVLTGHVGQLNAVAFSPDGRRIASAGWDGTARLWDAATGAEVRRFHRVGEHVGVRALAFSPDGSRLATARGENVYVWDVASGDLLHVLRHESRVFVVRWSSDGRRIASGGADVRLWDGARYDLVGTLPGLPEGVVSLDFTPDGSRLASIDSSGTVMLWNVPLAGAVREPVAHAGPVVGVAFDRAGETIASASYDTTVQLWSAATGAPRLTIRESASAVFSADFGPDFVVAGGADTTVHVFDAVTGHQRRVLHGHTAVVYEVRVSPDATHILSVGQDGTARVWDARSGDMTAVLGGHRDAVFGAAYAPGGDFIATSANDHEILIWNARGQVVRDLSGHGDGVEAVAFSPDGRLLVSGGDDKEVRLWDWRRGDGRVLARHDGRVYDVAFAPDGRRVASASADGTARVLPIDGDGGLVLAAHAGEVNAVRFSPDGSRVVTGHDDGTVRLWDARDGRPLWRAPLLLHRPDVVLYSHEGWRPLGGPGAPPPPPLRRAVEARARLAHQSADGEWVCIAGEAGVELWRRDGDAPALASPRRGDAVLALAGGCVVREGKEARLLRPGAADALLAGDARAVAEADGEILVATPAAVRVLDGSGAPVATLPAPPGVTALTRRAGLLVVALERGGFARPGRAGPPAYEEAPPAPAVALALGPAGTVVAGYADGLVGVWDLDGGSRLEAHRLRGPIAHLRLIDAKLYAASELGDSLAIDLSALSLPYCRLMARVWEGRPPPAHPCVSRSSDRNSAARP